MARDARTHQPKRKRPRVDPEWGTPVPAVNGQGQTQFTCGKCRIEQAVTEFYRARGTKRGHQSDCRGCSKARARSWQATYRERAKATHATWLKQRGTPQHESARSARLRRTYGFTAAQYEAKLSAQGGVCAICRRVPTEAPNRWTARFAVDHDHKTGHIRDLLCLNCNNGLGCFADDPERIEAALAYVQYWAAVLVVKRA